MIPKAGNTTTKYSLWNSECSARGYKPECDKVLTFGIHLRPDAPFVSTEEKFNISLPSNCYTFSVVRNPYTRALSGYLDKRDRTGATCFEEFLEIICHEDPLDLDHHFAPQWSLTWPEILHYDAIAALESFPTGLSTILDNIFGNNFTYTSRKHSTKSENHLSTFYTRDNIKAVRNYFLKDFKLFGYSENIEDVYLPPSIKIRGRFTAPELFMQVLA